MKRALPSFFLILSVITLSCTDSKIDKIKSASVKKVLGMIESMAKNDAEQYASFWKAFLSPINLTPLEFTKFLNVLIKTFQQFAGHLILPSRTTQ